MIPVLTSDDSSFITGIVRGSTAGADSVRSPGYLEAVRAAFSITAATSFGCET
jgi:hypothetical protein